MANQVRIEYDPYQQKASYQIRDSSNRKFAKIPKSDLGNPDNLKYHDGMLDEILKYAIPELQEKRLAKELVFCGTEDDFQDFKDALVRFYERNPDTTWNMTLLRDETSYYRAADTVKSEINAIFQGIVDTLTEKQNEDVYRDVCRKLESYTDAVSNEIPVCVIGVDLNADRLAMHTFITGSTGSGKSNTIYQLLHELGAQGRKFLVVEPAKGEYRAVFGSRSDVTVYGTNPNLKEAALLRLNPFSFPENVHVYEHMDRLVEIFNVCWPMYAAMPAVLKDAIERAYVDAGWDLRRSRNRYSARLFPTFIDVLQQIDAVMDESQYSADSKGDYKGSLCTRLRSLTNGINGMIFSADELDSADLFDRNVIVDLSRVGSTETKALIMGLLVMKLQEYRMSQGGMNKTLRHATVLEEAHNLLKRTSAVQSAVGADLAGKSVEMLANAIAEMRTYGEGFIIADQAPGLLDEAVIRNTNTKIILRLPDYADRQLVGKAIGLNDDQIDELSKLKQGVAAVYQNDWVEAVLCQVDRFEPEPAEDFSKNCGKPLPSFTELPPYDAHSLLIELASGHLYVEPSDRRVLHAELPVKVKCLMFEYGKSTASDKTEKLATVAYYFLNLEPAFKDAESVSDTAQRIRMIRSKLEPFTNELSEKEAAFDDYDRENGYEDEDEQPEENQWKVCAATWAPCWSRTIPNLKSSSLTTATPMRAKIT